MTGPDGDGDGGRSFALRDGTKVRVRPIRPDDGAWLEHGLRAMSTRSRLGRFGTVPDHFSARELRYLTEVDQQDHIAWIAFDVGGAQPVGVATSRCIRVPGEPEVAEPAVTVVDSHQGRGLGTLMLAVVWEAARQRGMRWFRSYVRDDNDRMIEILEQLGGQRAGREGRLLRYESMLCGPEELPDSPAGRAFRQALSAEA